MRTRTLTKKSVLFARISAPFFRNEKLDHYLFQPIVAGIGGFTTIILVLFFGDLFSSVLGIQSLRLDKFDLILGGIGFFMKFGEAILKNIGN